MYHKYSFQSLQINARRPSLNDIKLSIMFMIMFTDCKRNLGSSQCVYTYATHTVFPTTSSMTSKCTIVPSTGILREPSASSMLFGFVKIWVLYHYAS
jgi:hypothetical protein